MEDIQKDFLIKHFRIKEYYSTKPNTKFINDLFFIDKIKNKKEISLSDSTNIADNCYPNYLYNTDMTSIKIDNSVISNFSNLTDIMNDIDIKNNLSSSFVRCNKITDLSYIKKMSFNKN
jgi:uncharacterized protein YfkK (UPF0435 family)